ncbi:hypothetical protein [Bradyrhizobium sp. LHD-71]|uniref:hypothetical protein n=1 Tax=Bradyrhizobium sp. LHD-71 TaxID=3072141 RepID=UPI00280D9D2B|nr:hypothetical protein [Bradyrhizobium sp. LHD-71]MDQ8729286.1 hypothetical protein [Bradyrhizobium sp. LHD-71]
MGSEDEDRMRARVKLAGLEAVFAAFPEDVTVAIQQAETYNKAIAEQKTSPIYLGTLVPEEQGR